MNKIKPALQDAAPPDLEQLLDDADVARLLKLKPGTPRALYRRGRLAGVKLGKLVRFSPRDVAEFVERGRRG